MRSSFLAGPRRVRHERARCLSRSWATVTLAFVSLLSTSPAIASIDFAVPFHSYDVVAFPTSVAVGDLNGDGDLDVVVTNGGSSPLVSVLLGNGNGTLGVKTDLSVALISLSSVAIEDLNADGKLDL
ncbi:MAG TPA: VCBS repeat-containing protein, partial [Candidatus Eisenbacteria bacterium]